MKAECQCGQLTVELPGLTPAVIACHCIACQRRTGSPFGLMAYYPADRLTIDGDARSYERPNDEATRLRRSSARHAVRLFMPAPASTRL